MTDAMRITAMRDLAGRAVPGGALRRAWQIKGGVSAEVTGIEVAAPGGVTVRLVVRRHGEVDRRQNANVARDEYRLLEIARSRGLAVPRPFFFDESGDLLPTPFLVIEYVDGKPDLAPSDPDGWIDQSVRHLVMIHAITAPAELAFLPSQRAGPGEAPASLDESMGEGRIREALTSAGPPIRANDAVLLHGDYWPGNLLWKDDVLVAVIDWEDARTGDPLADLAHSRLEVLWAFGPEAMEVFTGRYRARCAPGLAWADLPRWDLIAALRPCGALAGWGLEGEREEMMRARHAWFVGRATGDLGIG